MASFIENAIEANGLLCAGGFNDALWGSMMAQARYASATEGQREAVRTWLRARPELMDIRIGPLCEDWHAPE